VKWPKKKGDKPNRMEKICKVCAVDPKSHSFKKVSEKGGISIYYSHPAQAKRYDDKEGIYNHIDNTLSHIGNKKWICIIDSEGFDLKHVALFDSGMGLMDLLINKYGKNLQEIRIINPSWHIKGLLKVLGLKVDPVIMEKIKIFEDRQYSILEFI